MATNRTNPKGGARRRIHLVALVAVLALVTGLGGRGHEPAEEYEVETAADEYHEGEEEELEGRVPRNKDSKRPTVEAGFTRESYTPGEIARLMINATAREITIEIVRAGLEDAQPKANDVMDGKPVTPVRVIGAVSGHHVITVRVGEWPSGLYFVRLRASGERLGHAPFIVRPRRLGTNRVAVVLPTFTWQAYNWRDGKSWYANWRRKTAVLARPYLQRGVPPYYRRYDEPFLRWLAHTGRAVDYLGDADLDAVTTGESLAAAYSLIVFPGHHEYVTTHEYDVVERYRDLGGNLMFLSANNFFWKVTRRGNVLTKHKQWRDLGRPEASLIGVQYIGNDRGERRGPWIVRDASSSPWLFEGTGLRRGSEIAPTAGIEIDHTAPSSPRGTKVIAEIPELFGPRFTAQMTYYETPRGAKVFAAGSFTLAGFVWRPDVQRLVANAWDRLASDSR
jgi:hypothetical protein